MPGDYVLIVADDPQLIMDLSEQFSSGGYSVAGVRTAPLALAAIQLSAPSLILYGLPLSVPAERARFRDLAAACSAPALLLDGEADTVETYDEATRILLLSQGLKRRRIAA